MALSKSLSTVLRTTFYHRLLASPLRIVSNCSKNGFSVTGGRNFSSNVYNCKVITCLSSSVFTRPASLVPLRAFAVETKTTGAPQLSPQTPEEDQEEAKEKKRRQVRYSLMGLTFAGAAVLLCGVLEWGPPRVDDKGNVIEDEYSDMPIVQQYVMRCWNTLTHYNEALKEPVRDLLLPEPLQAPYIQPPYTLVIESNGVLMHPDWTYKTGWRFKKRPFVEYLLQQCAPPLFEIVIFTQDQGTTAYPLIDSLDPNGYIMYRLFRDSTRYEEGVRIKDLNCLNRDLSRVIFVEWDDNACKLNKPNCLILKKWEGEDGDKTLFDLAQFLRAIAAQDVHDVREVITHYRKFDNPLEAFKEKQRQLLEHEAEQQRLAESAGKRPLLIDAFKRK